MFGFLSVAFLLVMGRENVCGFSHLARRQKGTYLFMSEPSDTSSDDENVITIESEPFEPTEEEALVTSVLDQLPSFTVTNKEQRVSINEALLKLERLNPTPDAATSPLINGVWELRYAGGYTSEWALNSPTRQLALFLYSGGYSPGLFAISLAQQLPSGLVELDDIEISISRDQPRVEARLKAGFFGQSPQQEVVVRTELRVQSGVRLQEVYESAEVLGQTISIPTQLKYSRDLYVTYVDDDLMIIRDGSGVPEVLVRKDKVFLDKWGTEPGDVDDLTAPGTTEEDEDDNFGSDDLMPSD